MSSSSGKCRALVRTISNRIKLAILFTEEDRCSNCNHRSTLAREIRIEPSRYENGEPRASILDKRTLEILMVNSLSRTTIFGTESPVTGIDEILLNTRSEDGPFAFRPATKLILLTLPRRIRTGNEHRDGHVD